MPADQDHPYRYALDTTSNKDRAEQRLHWWQSKAAEVPEARIGILEWISDQGEVRYTVATDRLELGRAAGMLTVEEQCSRVRQHPLLSDEDKDRAVAWYEKMALDDSGLVKLRLRGLRSQQESRAEAAQSITDLSFRQQRWENQPALVSKDGMSQRPYEAGEEFDPDIWDLVPDAWDHEHCSICGDHVCAHPDCGHPNSYLNNEGEWVCPPCFGRYLKHRA